MKFTAYIIFTIFLFFGLFSLAGVTLLLAQFKNESPKYVTAWIIGSTLLGFATILVSMKDLLPEFYSYKLGNGINIAGSVYFLYSGLFLLDKKYQFKWIALQAVLASIVFNITLEVVGYLLSVKYQPAVVAFMGVIFNLFSAIIFFNFIRNERFHFPLL